MANVYTAEGLPINPFRTDDFPMITDPANPNSSAAQAAKRMEELRLRSEATKKKLEATKKQVEALKKKAL